MKDNHVAVLLEDINHKFEIVLSIAADISVMKHDISLLKQDVETLKIDMRAVKRAITHTSRTVHDHEVRITALEAA